MIDVTIRVTKLDAAKRQLRTAIKLWFMDDDPVSIHTLVSAAHEVVHTLFKRKGLSGLVFNSELIVEEYRSDFAKRMKAQATFFKHAQRDPEAETDFNPALNNSLLLITVHGLCRMNEPQEAAELTLIAWFCLHKPHFFLDDIFADRLPVDVLQSFRCINKKDFFETCQLAFGRAS